LSKSLERPFFVTSPYSSTISAMFAFDKPAFEICAP
jgi:hypothetical protein